MMYNKKIVPILLSATLFILPTGCVEKQQQTATNTALEVANEPETINKPDIPTPSMSLPIRFQRPGYTIGNALLDTELVESAEEYQIKVGANIKSTRGPQPLWDIMKRLAALKGMSVSWSSDVNQNVLVDVDITASDDYYEAIDNLLRQVDYFHELHGSTIIIKYRETKTYHIAMPFTKQVYETAVGGNVLGSNEEASSTEGTIRLDSRGNEFNIWQNIQENLDAIIATWSTTTTTPEAIQEQAADEPEAEPSVNTQSSRQISSNENRYTIDKPVGIITVHAPRPLQNKITDYLNSIKKELYRQITIEAKIVEVQLSNSSSLGIDWNLLLNSISFGGTIGLADTYSKDKTTTKDLSESSSRTVTDAFGNSVTSSSNTTGTVAADDEITSYSSGRSSTRDSNTTTNALSSAATAAATIITNGVSNTAAGTLSLASFNFGNFINALSEQGSTSILANPKLSVMNGQPSLITVGRNVTYIEKVESDRSGENGDVTFTVETARILSGVGMSITPIIKEDNEIIMNIVPITSVLEEPIEYRTTADGGQVGLPVVNIREMSTMVEVEDGEMLVIGGLISSTEENDGSFLLPGVDKLPGLKYLFGYEEKQIIKRELIILLRPRII